MDVSQPLNNIATQGLLGSLLVVSLIVNAYLYRAKEKANAELLTMSEKRIQDLVQLKDVYTASALQSQQAFAETVEKFTTIGATTLEITKNIRDLMSLKGKV